jgi:hypothetical protein
VRDYCKNPKKNWKEIVVLLALVLLLGYAFVSLGGWALVCDLFWYCVSMIPDCGALLEAVA